ncbi:MAG: hypothetical protein C4K60_20720 [Ideonella sp. MAG2]|nr:MAG: hypothetical protein C4K60_20720 [Ideonella sp. MAG2]
MIPTLKIRQRRAERGQTMIEYVIILVAFAIVLLIPYDDKTSVLDQMLAALVEAYKRFSYALSLPT